MPGADLGEEPPVEVTATDEDVAAALAFFERTRGQETRDQKKRAGHRSAVFSIMQYRVHPETGEVMCTPQQLQAGLKHFDARLERWAYVFHNMDRKVDKKTGVAVELKPEHWHLVLKLVQTADHDGRATIREVSEAFSIPSARVRTPEDGELRHKGRGAAEKYFFDFAEYLPHESRAKSAIAGITWPERNYVSLKYQYARSRVTANFPFSTDLDAHMLQRRSAAASQARSAEAKKRDAIRLAVMRGEMTMKQVREKEPIVYVRDLDKLTKLRQDFMVHQPAPRHRTNYFMGGKEGDDRKGRTGKTALAKLHARMLYPDLEASECYYVATDTRVPLQNYQGQPVIIWDDYNALDLMEALGGRSGVWQVFDDHPSASDVNIKYGSIRLVHEVNIVTKTMPYAKFLDDLAGEYTDRFGEEHHAEDRNQSWGRFPLVFEVTTETIEMLLNRGFMNDSDDFLAYQKVARMRASMKRISGALDSIADDSEREAATYEIGNVLLRPILEQHAALQPVANRMGSDVVGEVLPSIAVLTGDAMVQDEYIRATAVDPIHVSGDEAKLASRAAYKKEEESRLKASRLCIEALAAAGFYSNLTEPQRREILNALSIEEYRTRHPDWEDHLTPSARNDSEEGMIA